MTTIKNNHGTVITSSANNYKNMVGQAVSDSDVYEQEFSLKVIVERLNQQAVVCAKHIESLGLNEKRLAGSVLQVTFRVLCMQVFVYSFAKGYTMGYNHNRLSNNIKSSLLFKGHWDLFDFMSRNSFVYEFDRDVSLSTRFSISEEQHEENLRLLNEHFPFLNGIGIFENGTSNFVFSHPVYDSVLQKLATARIDSYLPNDYTGELDDNNDKPRSRKAGAGSNVKFSIVDLFNADSVIQKESNPFGNSFYSEDTSTYNFTICEGQNVRSWSFSLGKALFLTRTKDPYLGVLNSYVGIGVNVSTIDVETKYDVAAILRENVKYNPDKEFCDTKWFQPLTAYKRRGSDPVIKPQSMP